MTEPSSGGHAIERRSPESAFALLGDDTRIDILQALGETPDVAQSFSDLRERVGVADSGQFNYHLRKLVGSFVAKTDDGYELTYAGRQVVGAMYAGTYTANARIEGVEIDGECPLCAGALEASYANETATMACTSCDDWRNEFSFPPGSLEQFDAGALPATFDRWLMHMVEGVVDGFCHVCAGRMQGTVVLDDVHRPFAGYPAHLAFDCARCGDSVRTAASTVVYVHPAAKGFLFEHGYDVSETPSWAIWGALEPPSVDVVSRDPVRLDVGFVAGDERLVGTVQADATVSAVRREPVV